MSKLARRGAKSQLRLPRQRSVVDFFANSETKSKKLLEQQPSSAKRNIPVAAV
ncbi:hypothetical protein SK128_006775, partial [Halocaridina rubra]